LPGGGSDPDTVTAKVRSSKTKKAKTKRKGISE